MRLWTELGADRSLRWGRTLRQLEDGGVPSAGIYSKHQLVAAPAAREKGVSTWDVG